MAETELDRAEKRYAQAKARLLALKNREATKARKLDTRRKIILGGALFDLAERDSNAAAMIERLIRNLPREQDRKAFEGWDAKQPATAPSATAPPLLAGPDFFAICLLRPWAAVAALPLRCRHPDPRRMVFRLDGHRHRLCLVRLADRDHHPVGRADGRSPLALVCVLADDNYRLVHRRK